MALVTSPKGLGGSPVPSHGFGANLKAQQVEVSLSANPSQNDTIRFFQLPVSAKVVGGWLYAAELDSNATPTLDIDLGWEANGVDAADADGLGNFGVWSGAAVTNVKPETGVYRVIGGTVMTGTAPFFGATTWITGTVNAVAATFAAGKINLTVLYVVDQ